MPRDLARLRDPALRPRVLRNRTGRFPFPVPNGWFIVAASADLMPGEQEQAAIGILWGLGCSSTPSRRSARESAPGCSPPPAAWAAQA
jgi:hypothetical protein